VRAARIESADVCEHRYRDASGHLALVVRLQVDGLCLAVANTHAKWSPRGTANAEHFGWRQLTELEEVRSVLVPEADAWILCGDMNFEPDEPIVAELGRRGFGYAHVGTDGRTCTTNGRAKLIDYLFYTEPLVAEPSPPEPLRDDSILPSALEPSDHLPLRADFRWAS
jgi:endonuclease/exonuclease/phosphatase family metal-dependent hydrolase